jgi:hypothetical protein
VFIGAQAYQFNMGEASVSEGVTALGPYLLLLVIMAILGSLVGVFTFCVRRKVGVC